MFKSDIPCSGEGCTSHFIQNKKYHLCSRCVFKKNHDGKSQEEVYSERNNQKVMIKVNGKVVGEMKSITNVKPFVWNKQRNDFFQDDESRKNEINQNLAEEEAKRELTKEKKKKRKPLSKKSKKQVEIDYNYKLVCIDMDHVSEPVCSGCLRYQGGDIKLSHSHIISRADCHGIGRPELIYDRENIKYHCLDFIAHKGCHGKWERVKERSQLLDYAENIEYIKLVAPNLLEKYLAK